MKIKSAIKSAIIGTSFLLFCLVCLVIIFNVAIRSSGTKTPEAIRLITQVEGVENINKDAEAIFIRFGTNGFDYWKGVDKSDLKNLPTISDLLSKFGNYSQVVIIPEGTMDSEEISGFPAQIRIRFGSHFETKFLFVVDPRKPFDAAGIKNREPHWTEVASNIFIEQ